MLRLPRLAPVLTLISYMSVVPALSAGPVMNVGPSDMVFQPTDEEGYMQAWNVNFRGNGMLIYITFVISNLGPKSLNNGVSILIVQKGQVRVWTKEYDYQSLEAKKGTFGHKSYMNWLRYENGKYFIEIDQGDKSTPVIKLEVSPYGPGLGLSDGKINVSGGGFIRFDVPVVSSKATGHMILDGKWIDLQGIGGMEYLHGNKPVHQFAKRFHLIRSYHQGSGFFVGGFYGTDDSGHSSLIHGKVLQGGKLLDHGVVKEVKHLKESKNAYSGYIIPEKTLYRMNRCVLIESRNYYSGGYYVLGNISMLLRAVLRVFFAKPYVLHYNTTVKAWCDPGDVSLSADALEKKKPTTQFPSESTFYLINP
ncbi:MAG: hypothetical protein CMN76_02630 [Spirochaetaceae bacterium]|nr:hypothetical protein [Spirochaetaceae bacterium]